MAAALMVWSAIAAPPVVSQEEPITEPEGLSAYSTFGDAAPVQLYFDHQIRFVPLGPAVAHAQSEVSQPSAASAVAWLVDGGVANGLHGTTTGAKVPTEASAQQPGGDESQEFQVAGGPIGDEPFMMVRAGRSFAEATHADKPRGYANSFLGNVLILPASGTRPDPPGTYNPDATFPGGDPDETDPAPLGPMGILSIGHIASTSESIREGSTVTSIAVAELKDINIGNRTADNRCTNCIRIDTIRVEAFAQAAGTEGGSRGAYRVTLGRACRRAFDAETGTEVDRCLPLDPHEPQGTKGLQSINELDALNEQFQEPIWTTATDGEIDYVLGIRITAGGHHEEPARRERTTSPPEDARRNYAYPDPRPKDPERPARGQVAPDQDDGEVARAVAEGPDIEIWTITTSQIAADAGQRLTGTPAAQALEEIDEDDQTPGIQITAPGPAQEALGTQTIPTESIRSVRRLHLTLGSARASALARSIGEVAAPPSDAGAPAGPVPAPGLPGPPGGVPVDEGAPPVAPMPAAPAGSFALEIDWSSFRVQPWAPADMAKAIGSAAIAFGALWLLRRRLRSGGGTGPGAADSAAAAGG